MKKIAFHLIAALISVAPVAGAAEPAAPRPNILWITSEDNSSHWIGCYGNKQTRTPRIDALAKEGVLFENAYSNAPVCAVARATILMGVYSPTMGTQHMRSRHPIPAKYRPNVEYLRAAGYYCTNNSKTDYNFKGNDASYWDKSSGTAHYKNRPEGKPFFAVFNITASHESSLFNKSRPSRDASSPRRSISRPTCRIFRKSARTTPATWTASKTWTRRSARCWTISKKPASRTTPSSSTTRTTAACCRVANATLEQTGVKVPFIVRIPEKFRSLSPFKPGERVTEPVSFVDLAPTLLSLAGLDTPAQMQGRPFLGCQARGARRR